MEDSQKISILIKNMEEADEKFDFQKMSKYVNDKWDLQLLKKHPEAASISNRGAIYYSALLQRKLTENYSEQESNEIADDCVDKGYPLYEWSLEKNYFHFAPALTEALIKQADYFREDGSNLPIKVLDYLPAKCGFISLDIIDNGWVSLEHYKSVVGSLLYTILGFIFLIKENGDNSGKHITICFITYDGNTVFGNYSFFIPANKSLKIEDIFMNTSFEEAGKKLNVEEDYLKEHTEMWINIALQHMLYLCSDSADIVQNGDKEETFFTFKRNNERIRINKKQVGSNISKKLSLLHNNDLSKGVKSRHIRRAHWHNRWVGKVNSKDRHLKLTWQHPSLVNMKYRAWSELGEDTKTEEERADHDLELQLLHISDKSYSKTPYINEPVEKPSKPQNIKSAYVYPRNKKIAVNALQHANYQCEISEDHPTFIRKRSKLPYVEPHHLVPLAFQDDFNVSLDREQNIISLCCNCHKMIHFGKEFEELLYFCYEKRKHALKTIGVDITYDELLQMYK